MNAAVLPPHHAGQILSGLLSPLILSPTLHSIFTLYYISHTRCRFTTPYTQS